jgi:hypothetical protein
MKHYLLLLITLIFTIEIHAAPSISGVSGTTTITISGSEFGTKPTAAPIKWDTFEYGVNGEAIAENDPGTPQWQETAASVIFDNSQSHSGDLSAYALGNITSESCSFYGLYIDTEDELELYATYWVYFDTEQHTTYPGLFWKGARFNTDIVYSGYPMNTTTYTPEQNGNPSLTFQFKDGTSNTSYSGIGDAANELDLDQRNWHRLEMYMKLSDPPGATNGVVYGTLDADNSELEWAWEQEFEGVSRAAGVTSLLNIFLLEFSWCIITESNKPIVWQDDIYVDNTRARVEIGNASTWDGCTHREIQPATAWTSGEITYTENQGTLPDGTAYLYVVDPDGVVSDGYQITFGATTNPTISIAGPGTTVSNGAILQ